MAPETNPYAPTGSTPKGLDVLAPMDAAEAGQIGFRMHNTRVVIQRCYQRRPLGRVAFLISLFASFVFLLSFTSTVISSRGTVISVSLLVIGLLPIGVSTGLILWLRSRWRTAIRQTPGLLEPTEGVINQLGVQTEQSGRKWFCTWTYAFGVTMNKHGVQISGEPWRLVSLIIPWESFLDEAAARVALTSVIRQRQSRSAVSPVDQQNTTESTFEDVFLPTSSPTVGFSGSVTFRDLLDTRAGRRMRRSVRIWFWVCLPVFLVGTAIFLLGQWWMQPAGMMAAMFTALMLFRLRKNPFRRSRVDEDAMTVRGWISADGVFTNTQSAQSLTMWSRYADHEIHPTVLCLRVLGSLT